MLSSSMLRAATVACSKRATTIRVVATRAAAVTQLQQPAAISTARRHFRAESAARLSAASHSNAHAHAAPSTSSAAPATKVRGMMTLEQLKARVKGAFAARQRGRVISVLCLQAATLGRRG